MSAECGCKRIGVRRDPAKRIGVSRRVNEIGIGFRNSIIVNGGSAKSIEQFWLIPSALGVDVITDEAIIEECEALFQSNAEIEEYDEQIIATISVDKTGGIMEEFWNIPDEIVLKSMSSVSITNQLDELWQVIQPATRNY